MELHRRCGGLVRGNDRVMDIVTDIERFGAVAGRGQRLADDNGNRVADIARLALHQARMAGRVHRRAVFRMDHPARRQKADTVGGQILTGQHGNHARHRHGGARVDGCHGGVGVLAAAERGIGLPGDIDVVGVVALAGDEAMVFETRHTGADPCLRHECFLQWIFPEGRTVGLAGVCVLVVLSRIRSEARWPVPNNVTRRLPEPVRRAWHGRPHRSP